MDQVEDNRRGIHKTMLGGNGSSYDGKISPLSSEKGLSIIEALILIGISGFVLASVVQLMVFMTSQQTSATVPVQLDLVRRNIITLVQGSSSWKNSIARNTGAQMNCLKNGTTCIVGGGPVRNRLFAIYDGSGSSTPYYDPTNLANGFKPDGTRCNTFSASGNAQCPFRYELKWSAMCPAVGPCVNPQVKVTADLIYTAPSGTKKVPMNLTRYSIPELYRSAQ
jgi:type II secretory pathway pseudopilin PulG